MSESITEYQARIARLNSPDRTAAVNRMRAALPPELLASPRWLLYRFEPKIARDGSPDKPAKVPTYFDGTKRRGKMNGPEDCKRLATFEAAACTFGKGGYAGFGIALGRVDGCELHVSGIDLDHCAANGTLNPASQEVVDATDSYCERSPSGGGLHILGLGDIGTTKKDAQGLEIYSTGRFFTMTGLPLTESRTLTPLASAASVARQRFGVSPAKAAPPPITHDRNNFLSREVFNRRHNHGMGPEALLAFALKTNAERCDPPLPVAEVESMVRSKIECVTPAPQSFLPRIHPYRGPTFPLAEIQDSLKALGTVFTREGELVGVAASMPGQPAHLVPFQTASLRHEMARAAVYVRLDKHGEEVECRPSLELADELMRAKLHWTLPQLTGLADAPFRRPDGSICRSPGYDAPTGVYGVFDPSQFPMPEAPTREDAQAAVATLRDLFGEFPFAPDDYEKHLSATLAACVTAVIRPSLELAPAYAVNAVTRETGKTTIQEVIAAVASTAHCSPGDFPKNPEELPKQIIGFAHAGKPCVILDNVPQTFAVSCSALDSAITSGKITGRLLGSSRIHTLDCDMFWMINGNSLMLGGDLMSRVLYTSLDTGLENPADRKFRRLDIRGHARQNRGTYVAAALTIVDAYRRAGCPKVEIEGGRSRFADWAATVRCAMIWAGTADPLATREAAREVDTEREALIANLARLHEVSQGGEFTVTEALGWAAGVDVPLAEDAKMKEAVQGLQEAIESVSPRGSADVRSYGRYLSGHRGQIAGGLYLTRRAIDGRSRYRVQKIKG